MASKAAWGQMATKVSQVTTFANVKRHMQYVTEPLQVSWLVSQGGCMEENSNNIF